MSISVLEQPAISLSKASAGTRSRIGGQPSLPVDVDWPMWRENPMSFIAQIALEELPKEAAAEFHLPATGTLYFFYDLVEGT